jgi:CheY-like chemotaxis protein
MMMRLEANRDSGFQHAIGTLPSGLSPLTHTSNTIERILVVEDDPAVQKALKRLFETESFEIEISRDGLSALEAFRKATPSAVVLDLRLPIMSGRDVCREIKQQAPSIPIIVLSAASDVSNKVVLLDLGADDYVTKPFSHVSYWRESGWPCAGQSARTKTIWLRSMEFLLTLPKWRSRAMANRSC